MASDKIDFDRLVKMFDLPDWDHVQERDLDYFYEAGQRAYTDVLEDARQEAESNLEEGEDLALKVEEAEKDAEGEAHAAREKAEDAAATEVYGRYHGAVMGVADELFEKHHLNLVPVRAKEKYPFEFKIQPMSGRTWGDAASQIAQTIEGVGMFSVAREDMRASKKFALEHLGAIADYPAVYGGPGPKRIYEQAWSY